MIAYAANARAVTFAHNESWCLDDDQVTDYAITWATEFRYDGARARYMNRPLDLASLGPSPTAHPSQPTVWSDYDDDEIYADFTVIDSTPTSTDKYEPGSWRRSAAGVVEYLHNDMLGTLRNTTSAAGVAGTARVFTAFGEPVLGAGDRFGYVGAYGYQAHAEMPFLHVGARYYDPSTGRFLQRDPIGVLGGTNVFNYVSNAPTTRRDPNGLYPDGGYYELKSAGQLGCGPSIGDIFKYLWQEDLKDLLEGLRDWLINVGLPSTPKWSPPPMLLPMPECWFEPCPT